MGAAGVKVVAATMASMAAAGATVDVIQQHEPMILGAAQSVLLASIAGALIGVYLHQADERKSIIPADGHGWRLAASVLWRASGLFFGVLCFAQLAGWTVTAASLTLAGKITALAPPCGGILAAFVKPLLPKYLSVLERIGEATGGLFERLLGGAPK